MHSIRRSLVVALLCAAIPAAAAQRLEVDPQTFDFGWAPDNAKITAEFTLRNTGEEMVPLTEIIPTCGCTAANFSPTDVGSKEETKVSLVFNTRGYANSKFHKAARVMTATNDQNPYLANVAGHVTNVAAKLKPAEGDGIAEFTPESTTRKKKITLVNNTGRDITLKVIQAPAGWADVDVPAGSIKSGETAAIEISVDGIKETRNTSITLAPSDTLDQDRVTLAIRTGAPAPAYRIAPVAPKPKATASPKPAAKGAPAKSQPKPKATPAPKK